MILEFVGIPGAGKSALAQQIVSVRSGLSLHVGIRPRPVGRKRRWLSRIADLGAVPSVGIACLPLIRNRETAILAARLCRYQRFRRSLHGARGVHVLEEGPLLGLSAFTSVQPSALQLLRRIAVPDIAIAVVVRPETALGRIRQRERSLDLERMADLAAVRVLTSHRDAMEAILAQPQLRSIVLKIDGEDPIHESVEKVETRLRKLCHQKGQM